MFVKPFIKTSALAAVVMLSMATAAWAQIDITADFLNSSFRSMVYAKIGKSAPQPILDTDVAGITEFDVSNASPRITSLAGIQHFVGLTKLRCIANELSSLDVSGLTNLIELYCDNNRLTSLNVSGLTNLTFLSCSNNNLRSLDVSGLTNLTALICNDNRLTSLNLSGTSNIEALYCDYNSLAELDVSTLTNLIELDCNDNQLTFLDVSALVNLTFIDCRRNNMVDEDAVIGFTGTWGDVTSRFRFYPQNEISSILPPTTTVSYNNAFRLLPIVYSRGLATVRYSLSTDVTLEMFVYNLKGVRMAHHPKRLYSVGIHNLTIKLPKGTYVLEANVFNGKQKTKFTETLFLR